MKSVLVIMAKVPLPGEVKTRLASILSPEGAAELARCFFLDSMDLTQSVLDCEAVLAYSPDDADEYFREACKKIGVLVPQGEGDLGQRMQRVFTTLFDQGYSRILLIGTDVPTLPLSHLQEAFSVLEEHPVVIGPSLDGGYYLLGLQTMVPEIFEDIDWGTEQVLHQTVERLSERDIQAGVLPLWYDVDTLEDLDFLIAHLDLLQSCTDERLPRHTVEFLEREGFFPERSGESQVDDG
jgi:rSAM/selenodomain-associated transferase 1